MLFSIFSYRFYFRLACDITHYSDSILKFLFLLYYGGRHGFFGFSEGLSTLDFGNG